MISTWLMKWLMVQYVLVFILAVYERNIPLMKYWAGAALLTWGVLTMGGK